MCRLTRVHGLFAACTNFDGSRCRLTHVWHELSKRLIGKGFLLEDIIVCQARWVFGFEFGEVPGGNVLLSSMQFRLYRGICEGYSYLLYLLLERY